MAPHEPKRPVGGELRRRETGVAFLCHAYHRGGVTRWMVDAANEFANRGVPTWFVAPQPRLPFASGRGRPTVLSLLRDLGTLNEDRLIAPPVGVPFELGTRGFRSSIYARAVLSGVPTGTPIIVSDDDDVWAAAASISDAYPMIGVLHADDPKYYRLARTFSSELAACVAVSKRIADKAAREIGLLVSVIPCGVPLAPLTGPTCGDNQNRKRLIWVGRLEEDQKRISDLPAIAQSLRDQAVSFSLQIIGDGPQRQWLRHEITHLGLEKHVELTGWLASQAIAERMRSSDVLLLPSNYEGMPVVVMEALAAGCAVVASRVSGVEDTLDDEIARQVVFIHDVGDTSNAVNLAMRALALPATERRRLARSAAERLFAIGISVDRYSDVISKLRPKTAAHSQARLSHRLNAVLSLPLAYARLARRQLKLARQRRAVS